MLTQLIINLDLAMFLCGITLGRFLIQTTTSTDIW